MSLPEEKRTIQRIQVEIPVHLNQEKAVTRDISWCGVYFLSRQVFSEGSELNFCIDFDHVLPGKQVKLDCQGEVLRIERQGRKYGVAAKIINFQYIH